MGNFYVNITTRKVTTNEIVDFINSKNLSAYIVSGPEDYNTVYEKICDDQVTSHISSLLKDISQHFSCPAFGIMNHDDDILAYELWFDGEKVDEYDSCPNYFDMEATELAKPQGGSAATLSQHLGCVSSEPEIEKILRKSSCDSNSYVFAYERHQALVAAIGLPNNTICSGYRYISQGEVPQNVDPDSIITING